MLSIKEKILAIIKELPDQASLDEIFDSIYVQHKILKAQGELTLGEGVSHEDVKKLITSWKK